MSTLVPGSAAPALGLRALTDLVGRIAAREALWRPEVRFEAAGRYWTKLVGDDRVDVWLLTWLQDQETDLHDHGGSSAAFTVVQGALREVRPVHGTTPDGADVVALSEFRRAPGRVAWVSPTVVHDVANPWPEPAVSIHAYSPPLTTMTYYRADGSSLVPVGSRVADGPER